MIKNILTIDVEDYFQVENFKKAVSFSDWDSYQPRVVENTEKILDILAKHDVKATFFILGWVAEKFPQLVRKIHDAGHEIASHGYSHQLIYSQTQQEFKEDLRKSKKILEDIIKTKVNSYRAPCYSVTEKSKWALDILAEEGFKYDSSIFPIQHDRGGLPDAQRYPYKIYNHNDYMWELPLSTISIFNKNLPFSGGGYFRLLPYSFIKWSIKKLNKEGHPVVMYMHPWEFDPNQPRIKTSRLNSFRHYVNIDKTEGKLKKLLKDFQFSSIRDCFTAYGGSQ